ncbi:TonB-dependent receptor [Cobetia sp. UIB-001]|uniref:TonB-dependent receptor domain-containing protein n=1 Tax=Cobetia sp. UIB-001 TaxID=2717697 RepID=UPI00384A977F
MHLRLHPLTAAVLSASALTLSLSGHASADDMSTLVISEDRLEQNVVISAEEIDQRQARDLEDLFRAEPGVSVGGGIAIGQKVYVRGLEDTNLNVTIDGARQGGYLFHHTGRLTIDPALLKQAEVDKGPATADDGPGALGGSLRFETKDAQDLLKPGQDLGARVSVGTESAADATSGTTAFYGRLGENLGLMGYVSGRNSDDYEVGGGGEQEQTAGQQRGYLLKMSLLDVNDQDLRISAERTTDHGTYFTRPHMPSFSSQQPTYQEMERETFTVNHAWHPGNDLIDTRTTLYHTTQELDRVEAGSTSRSREFGADVRNTLRLKTGDVAHALTTGVDFYDQDTRRSDDAGSAGPNNEDTSRNLGVYAQNRMTLGPWALSVGARLDDYDSDYGEAGSVSGSEVSPNAILSVDATDNLTLHAGYGEAIRGAKAREVILIGDDVTIAEGLEPERARQREIGLDWHQRDALMAGDRLGFALTGFHTDIENYQAYDRGSDPAVLYNLEGEVESRGYEASLNWGVGGYDTRLGYAKVVMKNNDGDPLGDEMNIGASTGDKWTWDHQYRLPNHNVTLGYTLNAVERLERVAAGDEEKPGYVTHDIRAQWTPASYQDLTLTLAVNNVFDKRYSDHSSYLLSSGDSMLEPGRDIRLGASYSF